MVRDAFQSLRDGDSLQDSRRYCQRLYTTKSSFKQRMQDFLGDLWDGWRPFYGRLKRKIEIPRTLKRANAGRYSDPDFHYHYPSADDEAYEQKVSQYWKRVTKCCRALNTTVRCSFANLAGNTWAIERTQTLLPTGLTGDQKPLRNWDVGGLTQMFLQEVSSTRNRLVNQCLAYCERCLPKLSEAIEPNILSTWDLPHAEELVVLEEALVKKMNGVCVTKKGDPLFPGVAFPDPVEESNTEKLYVAIDRNALREWFERQHQPCPEDRQILKAKLLTNNPHRFNNKLAFLAAVDEKANARLRLALTKPDTVLREKMEVFLSELEFDLGYINDMCKFKLDPVYAYRNRFLRTEDGGASGETLHLCVEGEQETLQINTSMWDIICKIIESQESDASQAASVAGSPKESVKCAANNAFPGKSATSTRKASSTKDTTASLSQEEEVDEELEVKSVYSEDENPANSPANPRSEASRAPKAVVAEAHDAGVTLHFSLDFTIICKSV